MRLLICNISRSLQGGVENIVADLVRKLPSRGIDPVVGLTKGARYNDPEPYQKAFPDLPVVIIDESGKGTRQARIEALERSILKVQPDVVLIARVYDAYEAVTRIKHRHGWPRLAVTIQAYEPHYLYDARLYRNHIDLCVTSGELVRQGVIHWSGLAADRVVNIPGGVAAPKVSRIPRAVGEPIRIGYVGRLDPGQKRALDFIGFVQRLNARGLPYTLDLVGSGPAEEGIRAALADDIRQGRVRMHGWVGVEDLYQRIYPRLDLFAHFAHTEGVTIAPREAMAHGVVPVISRFVGLAAEGQFLDGANALTFPVGDLDAAVSCVMRLVEEPATFERLSAAAARSQGGRYSEEGAIDAWADAFKQCLERPVATGQLPRIRHPDDGRLARIGLSPWLAQRARDVLGRRYPHDSGANEWPTGSAMMDSVSAGEISAVVDQLENDES